MSKFSVFGKAVHHAYNTMLEKDSGQKRNLFLVDITGDELWDAYLAAFPDGTNPMFRERTEHDCSCCRNFVKNLGAIIYVDGTNVHSVWDVNAGNETYQAVTDELSKLVKSKKILRPFIVGEPAYGAEKTDSNGEVWYHFHGRVPATYLYRNNESNYVGERNEDMKGLRRSIKEISDSALEIVGELIAQDSLHKGPEYKWAVDLLMKLKREYAKLKNNRKREVFLWLAANRNTRIRGTVIGTLLTDLTDGVELEVAVKKFEDKVSGTNYKRSKALVTQKMIDEAKKVVTKLGLDDSLARRYAVREDISVNDVLFVDGTVKPALLGGAFDGIKPSKKAVPEFKNIDEISIKDFIKNVLPKADTVEVFVKNKHVPKLVSLIAPVHADAKPLFKWDNAFSWSFKDDVADAIKERVKAAGGKVDGEARVSLSWHNHDDLDLHMHFAGQHLFFRDRRKFGAQLDLDMNGSDKHDDKNPVENIFWHKAADMKPGRYEISVHNWTKRKNDDVGFEVQVEILGDVYSFAHPKDIPNNATVKVGAIVVGKDRKITVEGFNGGTISKEEWNIKTEDWVPVDLITRSPNFWNDQKIGHEHVFFMLRDCVREEATRGFYNEYLREELVPHRKVFELVAGQLKAPYSENQLSGLGFSVTSRDEMQVRVKGAINRVLTVKF